MSEGGAWDNGEEMGCTAPEPNSPEGAAWPKGMEVDDWLTGAAAGVMGGADPKTGVATGDAEPKEAAGGAAEAPAADPAGRGTSEGIIAACSALTAKRPVVVKGLHPSVPHPVDGGLSSVDGTE